MLSCFYSTTYLGFWFVVSRSDWATVVVSISKWVVSFFGTGIAILIAGAGLTTYNAGGTCDFLAFYSTSSFVVSILN